LNSSDPFLRIYGFILSNLGPYLVIVFIVGIISAYVWVVYRFYSLRVRRRLRRNAEKRLYMALRSTITSNLVVADRVQQFQTIFKKWTESNRYARETMRDESEALEVALYYIDAFSPEERKERGVPELIGLRQEILEMLSSVREANPFASLSGRQGSYLNTIKQAVESSNRDLAMTTLNQIASEFEIADKAIKEQSVRSTTSFIISVVGVILTVVFGAVTIIQYVSALSVARPTP
jgi:hypothetical protein